MSNTLLDTKFYIPKSRPKVVHRPQLIHRLNSGSDGKLTLVSAPAGYGKTTMIEDWVKTIETPFAWLSLDVWDNDPIQFLTYFVAALQRIDKTIGQTVVRTLQSTKPPPLQALVTKLITEVTDFSNSFILIVDDYHNIHETQIHEMVSTFIHRQPPNMHLVLLTREDPPFPLARLRVRREISEIRAVDLRFSRYEAKTFFNEVMGLDLSAEEVAMLEVRTEGWIAGLLMAAHSLKSTSDRWAFLRDFAGDDRQVMDYLVDEVLTRLPEEIHNFLLKTSILDRMSAELCQAVVYGGGTAHKSQQMLEYLEKANLFTHAVDPRQRWYRYHHLFSELLQNNLRLRMPEEVAKLHHSASKWFETYGKVTQSIQHAMAMNDFERVQDLIEAYGQAALSRGEVRKVQSWLRNLPENLIRSRSYLCALFAWTELLTHFSDPPATVDHWIEQAENSLASLQGLSEDQERDKHLLVTSHINAIRAVMAFFRGLDPRSVIDLARQSLDLVEESDSFFRSILLIVIAMAYVVLADIESATTSLEKARQHARASNLDYIEFCYYYDRALIAIRQGRLRAAEVICHDGLRSLSRSGKTETPFVGGLDLLRGRLLLERGELIDAERMLKRGLDLIALTGEDQVSILGRSDLVRLYLALGDWISADEVIHQIKLTPRWSASFGSAMQALLWLRQAEHAPAWRNRAFQWAEEYAPKLDGESDIPAVIPIYEGKYAVAIISARVSLARVHAMPTAHREEAMQPLVLFLDGQLRIAQKRGWNERVIELAILKALALRVLEDIEGAMRALLPALMLGEPESYVRIFVDEGPAMGQLLYEAATRGTMQEYVGRLLAAFPDSKPISSAPLKAPDQEHQIVEPLSDRELEVLCLIADGLSNREIGQRLFLSLNTVKGHNRNIFGKLGVSNRTQAVARARMMGMLPQD